MQARSLHGRNSDAASAALQEFIQVIYQYRHYYITKQSEHEACLVDDPKHNPTLFYSYIRNNEVGRPSIVPLKVLAGRMITEPQSMTDVFADEFSSVYIAVVPDSPSV